VILSEGFELIGFSGSDFSVSDLPPDFVFDVGSLISVLLCAARTSILDLADNVIRGFLALGL
jgi:hypothetical protein